MWSWVRDKVDGACVGVGRARSGSQSFSDERYVAYEVRRAGETIGDINGTVGVLGA